MQRARVPDLTAGFHTYQETRNNKILNSLLFFSLTKRYTPPTHTHATEDTLRGSLLGRTPWFPNSSLHGRCSNLTVPPADARGGDGHLLCTRRGGDAYYSIFSPAWNDKVDPYLECFPLGEKLPEMKTPVLLQESVKEGKEGATCASPRGMVEELVRRRTAAIQAKPNGAPDAVLVYATTSAEFNQPADLVAASSSLYALSHGYIVHHVKAGPACGAGRNRTVPEGYPDPFLPRGGWEFCASGSASKCCWVGFYLTPYWMKAMALLQVSWTHKKVPWIVWLDTDVDTPPWIRRAAHRGAQRTQRLRH